MNIKTVFLLAVLVVAGNASGLLITKSTTIDYQIEDDVEILNPGFPWTQGPVIDFVYGGEITGDLNLTNVRFQMSGGILGGKLTAGLSSTLFVENGYIGDGITIAGHSSGHLTGSEIHGDIVGHQALWLIFTGENFKIDGELVDYGVRLYGQEGVLTGRFYNSHTLNNYMYFDEGTSVVFVPEPATLVLLGLAVIVFGVRKE